MSISVSRRPTDVPFVGMCKSLVLLTRRVKGEQDRRGITGLRKISSAVNFAESVVGERAFFPLLWFYAVDARVAVRCRTGPSGQSQCFACQAG